MTRCGCVPCACGGTVGACGVVERATSGLLGVGNSWLDSKWWGVGYGIGPSRHRGYRYDGAVCLAHTYVTQGMPCEATDNVTLVIVCSCDIPGVFSGGACWGLSLHVQRVVPSLGFRRSHQRATMW